MLITGEFSLRVSRHSYLGFEVLDHLSGAK